MTTITAQQRLPASVYRQILMLGINTAARHEWVDVSGAMYLALHKIVTTTPLLDEGQREIYERFLLEAK